MTLVIVLGPTAAGKSKVITNLRQQFRCNYVSPDTTRASRPDEADKRCISEEDFERLRQFGAYKFVNRLFGNWYGTPAAIVDQALATNDSIFLLDFPIEECQKLEALAGYIEGLAIMPPSEVDLIRRLKGANRSDRIAEAVAQLRRYQALLGSSPPSILTRGVFVNDDLAKCTNEVASALGLIRVHRTEKSV